MRCVTTGGCNIGGGGGHYNRRTNVNGVGQLTGKLLICDKGPMLVMHFNVGKETENP